MTSSKDVQPWSWLGLIAVIALLGAAYLYQREGGRIFRPSQDEDKPDRAPPVNAADEPFLLRGHSQPVTSLAFSSDGKRLASASWDATVKLWNPETGEALVTLKAGEEPGTQKIYGLNAVAFTQDGKRLVTAGGRWYYSSDRKDPPWGQLTVWDPAEGRPLQFDVYNGVCLTGLARSGTGDQAIAATDGTIYVTSGWSRSCVLAFDNPHKLHFHQSVAFGGNYLAAGGGWGVKVWEVSVSDGATSCRELWEIRDFSNHPNCLAFAPDGSRRLAIASGAIVKLWDTVGRRQLLSITVRTDGDVGPICFSPDSTKLATAAGQLVQVWNPNTGQQLVAHRTPDIMMSLAFSPDGKRLAAGGWDGLVRVWFLKE